MVSQRYLHLPQLGDRVALLVHGTPSNDPALLRNDGAHRLGIAHAAHILVGALEVDGLFQSNNSYVKPVGGNAIKLFVGNQLKRKE